MGEKHGIPTRNFTYSIRSRTRILCHCWNCLAYLLGFQFNILLARRHCGVGNLRITQMDR